MTLVQTEPSSIYIWSTPVSKVYVWSTQVRPKGLIYNPLWYWTTGSGPLKSAKEYLTEFGNECVDGIYEMATKDWNSTYLTYCDMTTLGGWWTMIFKSVQNTSNNVSVDLNYNDSYWTNRWEKNATIANIGNNWTINVATLANENVNADTLMVYCDEIEYQYFNWQKQDAIFTPTLNYSYWTNTVTWRTFKETYQNNWGFSNWVWDIPSIQVLNVYATSLYTNSYQEKSYSHTYSRMWIAMALNNYDSTVVFWIWLYSKWYTHASHRDWQWYQLAWVFFDDYYTSGTSWTTRWLNCRIYVREN